ncbi:MAG: MazG family protein [Jatrophihabitans sp.]
MPASTDGDSALFAAVEVMDRLRAPGGCPWDAAQTHRSLAPYLLEETYEVLEAIDAGDDDALREELGDLLLQVLFHARLAEENDPAHRWSIDEVAAGLVEKLRRRHPHVFAGVEVSGADEVNANWDRIKQDERAAKRRLRSELEPDKTSDSITDSVPIALPALALAAKLYGRATRAGLAVSLPPGEDAAGQVGAELFAAAIRAADAGVDPEQALRERMVAYRAAVRAAEDRRRQTAGHDNT